MYRCFIVWGRNYFVIIVPFLLLLADIGKHLPRSARLACTYEHAAIGIFWVYTLSLVVNGENIFTDALSVRLTTFYVITFVMNAMCTCRSCTIFPSLPIFTVPRPTALLAFRIWRIQRNVAPFARGNEDLSRISAVIIESGKSRKEMSCCLLTPTMILTPLGSAYSVYLILMIATYTSNSPAMLIFLNSVSTVHHCALASHVANSFPKNQLSPIIVSCPPITNTCN
jgi:hypothetical protein